MDEHNTLQRKQVDMERLAEHEAKYFLAAIVESSRDSIVTVGPDSVITSWNNSAETLYGYTAEEAVGQSLTMLTLPEDLKMILSNTDRVMHSETVVMFDTVRVHKDGHELDLEIVLSPVKNDAGEVIGVSTIARDITDRLQMESNIRFQARLLDAVEQGVIAIDMEGKVMYWNRFAEKMYGWSAKEAIGQTVDELIVPEMAGGQGEEIMAQLAHGKSWEGEFTVRRKDGSTFPAHVSDSPIHDAAGKMIGVIGISSDITERKEAGRMQQRADENMRLIMESVKDYAIYTMDPERRITSWNLGAEEVFGYSAEEAIGQLTDILFTPEDNEVRAPETEARTALTLGRAADERWHIRKDGSRFYASGVTNVLHNGAVHGFVKVARDLTERKQVEEALRESEERLRIALMAADMGTWDLDLKTGLAHWNEHHFKLFGMEPRTEPVSLDEFFQHVHPDYREPLKAQIDKAIIEGGVFEAEFCAVLQDGTTRWMSDYGTVMMNAAGEPVRASGVMMDIHERKSAEERLRASEERLRLATVVTQLGTCDWDYQEGYQRWNEVRFRMHGLEPEDRPVPTEEFFSLLHPEDHIHTKEVQIRGVEEHGEHSEEYRTVWPDGTVRWIHEMGQVMERLPDGRPKRIISVTSDITDRKIAEEALRTSEQRYQAFVQQSTEGIWRFEMAKPIPVALPVEEQIELVYSQAFLAECNDAMAEMYGYERAADIIGWPIEKFLPRNGSSETYLKNFIASGYRVVNAESRERTKEGKDVYFINNLIGIVEDGFIKRAWGTQSDITARKILEKQKDEFIGVASHELRTPVTSIKAYAETLHDVLEEVGDPASAELAVKLDEQVDRLRVLIHDLLDATHLTEGGGQFRQEPFDLAALITETADSMQRTTKTHRLELNIDTVPPVTGDRDRIQQVLNNLLANAIKYSPDADRVVVSASADQSRVVVSVQDFGIGIRENTQSQIFERFFRAPDPKISTYPGLGLGLYIAAEIVKRHGGELWVESKHGKGSTFFFSVPI